MLPGSFAPAAFTAPPEGPRSPLPNPQRPRPSRRRAFTLSAIAALIAAGAGVAYLATQNAPPRVPSVVSGRAGLKHTASGKVERWWRNRVTVTLDDSLSALSPATQDAVQDAFGAWLSSDAKVPRLVFDSRKTKPLVLSPDGENRIYYAPITVPGHEGDLAITLSYTNPATGEIVEADVVINSLRPFALLTTVAESAAAAGDAAGTKDKTKGGKTHTTSAGDTTTTSQALSSACTDKYDLRSVVTHEVGHFFGLGEDMTDTSATMYYSTKPCDVGKRDLKTDDSGEASSLYEATPEGAPSDDAAAAQKCSVASRGRREKGPSVPVVLTALGVGVALTRRRRRRRG